MFTYSSLSLQSHQAKHQVQSISTTLKLSNQIYQLLTTAMFQINQHHTIKQRHLTQLHYQSNFQRLGLTQPVIPSAQPISHRYKSPFTTSHHNNHSSVNMPFTKSLTEACKRLGLQARPAPRSPRRQTPRKNVATEALKMKSLNSPGSPSKKRRNRLKAQAKAISKAKDKAKNKGSEHGAEYCVDCNMRARLCIGQFCTGQREWRM